MSIPPRETVKVQRAVPDEVRYAIEEALRQGIEIPEFFRSPAFLNPALGDPDWERWVYTFFPHICTSPFNDRMRRVWNWFDAIKPDMRARPLIVPWPRNSAKSTTMELCLCRMASRLNRRAVLWINSVQEQADEHIESISARLLSLGILRAMDKYGRSLGWNSQQVRTANGFTVAGFGLNAARRGLRFGDFRPSVLVFDDIDERHDSKHTVLKKIEIITQSIIPSGSSDCVVVFAQNLVHEDSIMAQMVDGRATFLLDREVLPLEPAIENLQYTQKYDEQAGRVIYFVTGGTPTWEGHNLKVAEHQINTEGLDAYLRESQHDVAGASDGLWSKELLDMTRKAAPPAEFTRIVVGVDPNSTEGGDEAGVIVMGSAIDPLDKCLHGYVLEDCSVGGGPLHWAKAAVEAYKRYKADCIVAESNNGGDMVKIVIGTIPGAPAAKLVHASRGKITRAEPVHTLYEQGRIHHVGEFGMLEHELTRYRPQTGQPSPGRLDSLVWASTELMLGTTNTSDALAAAVQATNTAPKYGFADYDGPNNW